MIRIALGVFVASLGLAGCGTTKSGPGPLDGTWNVAAITCNGEAGDTTPDTGAGSSISGGKSHIFILDNLSGSQVIASASCTVTYDLTLEYPADGQLTLTHSGTPPTCVPAGCDATLCSTAKSNVSVYSYTVDGLDSVTLTSGFNTDLTCTGATPFQDNPVAYTLVKQ